MCKIITITEAARQLGVTTQTLRNWHKNGIIEIKRIGNASYINKDFIDSLAETAVSVETSRKKLEDIKAEYDKDSNYMWRAITEEREDRRYAWFCVRHARERGIFTILVRILVAYGVLKEREGAMLTRMLHGETIEKMVEDFGLTRERVRQIIEKAIRKSYEITEIEETLKRLRVLEEENRILKTQIATLTQEEKTGVDEKMKELLCTKTETCNLSTRAINILRVNDIRTIGALCVTHPRYFRNRRNLGKKTERELTDFLEGLGLSWNMDINKYF